MQTLSRNSTLWGYLEPDLQGLISDGEILLDTAETNKGKVSDFSYLVFPFSKAYEGFLKKLFLDLDVMQEDDYYGDDIRIGRILNPGYIEEHQHIYKAMCLHKKGGVVMTNALWQVCREARNQVFHYFPHNFRSLSYGEALDLIHKIMEAMNLAVSACGLK